MASYSTDFEISLSKALEIVFRKLEDLDVFFVIL